MAKMLAIFIVIPILNLLAGQKQFQAEEVGQVQYCATIGHFYQHMHFALPRSWDHCRDSAVLMGGHLVTIESKAENDFIRLLGNNDRAWIGGFYDQRDLSWKWVTGETFWKDGNCVPGMYCNWLPGKPGNCHTPACGPKDYMEVFLGKDSLPRGYWNDQIDSFPGITSFIVEYDNPCGDANADGIVNFADAVYLMSFIFAGGPKPHPAITGDTNHDGRFTINDAVVLISYVISNKPLPCP